MSNTTNNSPLKQAFLAIEKMQVKLEDAKAERHEAIAIVGMSCRFPGGADNPEAFWELIKMGRDGIKQVPRDRWNIDEYYDPNPNTPGKICTRWGGFLNSKVDEFDPHFFGLTPREVSSMDPQQRLLLEVSWEALERAAIAPHSLKGSSTGVFVGINTADYGELQTHSQDISQLGAHFFTGNTASVAAGRLAYILGLQGPTLAVDTACSSSLVGVHLACQSLRTKECDLAIVGGVNLMLSPQTSIMLSQMRALAADGRCKTFAANADGYGRGEGCGVIVIKRLKDALADGDPILAQIRGTAVNHDGSSSGLTVPNGLAQQKLIRSALANGRIAPEAISYVELHGTGTALGDPIEVEALGAVLGNQRQVTIGSVKANIGHLEAAAGMAGVIKVVLSLQKRQIPPQQKVKELNSAIDWQNLSLTIPDKLMSWSEKRLVAGVSSFGMSGTNAHIILENYEIPRQSLVANVDRPLNLLNLAAKNETALKELARRYLGFFSQYRDRPIADICFTANVGRTHFQERLSIVGDSLENIKQKLASFVSDEKTTDVYRGKANKGDKPKIAFLFTGQGSQYLGMGYRLYQTQPTFKRAIDRCSEILQPYLDISLQEILYPSQKRSTDIINLTQYTQSAIFAVEYALAELWQSWGVQPDLVMGHSVGEYVAATVAGVFTLEDALKLIAHRGRLMQALPTSGKMVAVFASERKVREIISEHQEKIAVAAINAPEITVLSGRDGDIDRSVATFTAMKISSKPLKANRAFHSPEMEPMLADFQQIATEIDYQLPQMDIIANVTGAISTQEIATPEYWCRQIVEPVRFTEGMRSLQERGCEVLIEVGAKPTLLGLGRSCLAGEGTWLPSLRSERDDWQQLLASLAQLYVRGLAIDWQGFDRDYHRQKLELPTYPFQRQSYWFERERSLTVGQNIIGDNQTTSILGLLQQEDTQNLARQLVNKANFSASEAELIPRILQVLSDRYQQQLKISAIRDWFYELAWQPQPRQEELKTTSNLTETWLIMCDRTGVGRAMAEWLQQLGIACVLAYADSSYGKVSERVWQLNPSQPEQFERLLAELEKLSLTRVIQLWSLDTPSTTELDISSLEAAQFHSCGSTLYLVKALARYKGANLPKLWLVTKEATVVDSESVALAQAALWGLGKVIADEHPEFWGGLLDSDFQELATDIISVVTEIVDAEGEANLAFRNGKRYVCRLVRRELAANFADLSLPANGSYLITGGLGALGLEVARQLADLGAKKLILLSRRQPDAQQQQILTELEAKGVGVKLARADVSSKDDLLRVLAEIEPTNLSPLRGIIHTAGVLRDGVLIGQSWQRFQEVMAPKVRGAWYLHSLTQDLELDFFILFSSATSFLGSPGQGNYAAANAFLDALTFHRRGMGLTSTTINWGPWGEVGMTARMNPRDRERLRAKGLELIQPEQGLKAFEWVLSQRLLRRFTTEPALTVGQDIARVGIFNINWANWLKQFSANALPAYLRAIAEEGRGDGENGEVEVAEPQIFAELLTVSSQERKSVLITYLQTQIARILQLEPDSLTIEESLVDRGMDSLMVMEAVNLLQEQLQLMLYPREFYEHPKIEALARYLLAEFERVHASLLSEPQSFSSLESAIARVKAIVGDNTSQTDTKPPIFILSSPRSGSTLLRVMLAGHSRLFSPPELHLLPFNNMAERQEELALSYFGEGLQRALMEIMELDAAASQRVIEEMVAQNYPIFEVYRVLQQLAGRQLIDKSPTYAMSRETLAKAEQLFPGAKYIYLTRHPYAAIESFARMRMDKLINSRNAAPHLVAEEIWRNTNRNILDFLQHSVEPHRYYRIRYEELVKHPQSVMKELCKFLQISLEENLLQPYQGERMTDGIHARSMSIGDPNFAKRDRLDPQLAETWKQIKLPHSLGESTIEIAKQLQYELSPAATPLAPVPLETATTQFLEMRESFIKIRGDRLCLCEWGDRDKPLILCLHGILEQGAAWLEVARSLAQRGYWVVAPDLRGHGRSDHWQGSSASFADFLADTDALAAELTDLPFTLVGHSLGSMVAAMLASIRSPKIKSLVLVETILPTECRDREIAARLTTYLDYLASPPQHPVFPDVATAASRLKEATPTMSAALSLQLARRITEPCQDGVRWRWDSRLRTRALINACGFPVTKAQYLELLRQISAPITLVYGDRSKLNRKEDVAMQTAAMPDARQIALAGGHNLHIDTPQALAAVIAEVADSDSKVGKPYASE